MPAKAYVQSENVKFYMSAGIQEIIRGGGIVFVFGLQMQREMVGGNHVRVKVQEQMCLIVKVRSHGQQLEVAVPLNINALQEFQCLPLAVRRVAGRCYEFKEVTINDVLECFKYKCENYNVFGFPLNWPKDNQHFAIQTICQENGAKIIKKISLNEKIYDHLFNNVARRNTSYQLQLYIRWPIEYISLEFLSLFVMRYCISDITQDIRIVTSLFTTGLSNALQIKRQFQLAAHFGEETAELNQYLSLRQLIKKYKAPLTIRFTVKQHKLDQPYEQMIDRLIENGHNLDFLKCPISYAPIINACIIKQCGHIFQQIYIKLSIYKDRRCPMCRNSTSLGDLEQLDIVSEVVEYLRQETVRWNEMIMIRNQLTEGWNSSGTDNMM